MVENKKKDDSDLEKEEGKSKSIGNKSGNSEELDIDDNENQENDSLNNKDNDLDNLESKLNLEINKLKQEISEMKDSSLRQMAEFDNFRKRTIKEKKDIQIDTKIKTIADILPIVDTFEKALEFECHDEEFKKGIDMIKGQLSSALEKLGVEEIDALGNTFDPDYHNAISQIQDENFGENTVSTVCQKGYKLGDKVIRHSMVIVANP